MANKRMFPASPWALVSNRAAEKELSDISPYEAQEIKDAMLDQGVSTAFYPFSSAGVNPEAHWWWSSNQAKEEARRNRAAMIINASEKLGVYPIDTLPRRPLPKGEHD